VVNAYFPNGNGKDRDLSRIPYKLAFYRRLFERLEKPLRDGARVLVVGDFNTAHQDIDLARPRENRETSGFRPEEREEFDRWIRAGWVDTFRHFNKAGGHYSWWSQRVGVREKNIGWRLDYILASPAAMTYVRRACIHPNVLGSDHCPVSVDLDPAVR
jgi:exodeoxyribonuclease-3